MGKSVVDHFTARLRLDLAAETWGAHPWGWPRPPATRPPWLAFRERRNLAAMERVFGPLDATALARFHAQARTGQSVHEDCGGYLLRCYRAMIGLPVEEPYTYAAAARDALDDIPEPVISAVERALDECSAWIVRPSPEVTRAVALAAGMAWHFNMEHAAKGIPDMECRISDLEAELRALRARLPPTPTVTP